MSWSLKQSAVGSASGNTGTTASATFASAVTPGNTLFVFVQTQQASSTRIVSGVTDSASNSYTAHGYGTGEYGWSGTYADIEVWTALATTSATPTVSVTISTAAYINVVVAEFACPGGMPLICAGSNTTPTAGSTLNPGSISTTGNDLVVGIGSQLNTSNPTWTDASGYSTLGNVPWSSTTSSLQIEYLENTTNPANPTLTSSQSVFGVIQGWSFKQVVPVYTLAGPSVYVAGHQSGTFSVTPSTTIASDTLTMSDGGAGGTFSPSSLTYTNTSAAQTFTYTPPASAGPFTITLSSASGGTITGSPWTYTFVTPQSFRCTGDLYLQTASNTLYASMTSFSMSFLIKYNSTALNSGQTQYEGFLLTQQYNVVFDVFMNQTTPSVKYTFANNTYSLSCAIIPGLVYHVAMVWTSGLQTIYVNGIANNTGNATGTTGPTSAYATMLGWQSTNSTIDYEISQVATWNNYALTSSDVTNLQYQIVSPMAIGGGPTTYWPFGGTPGTSIALGDAGVMDVTGLANFISLEATNPSTYPGGGTTASNNGSLTYSSALAYVPPVSITEAYVSKSGGLLFFFLGTTVGTPVLCNIHSVNAQPTIYVNGTEVAAVGPFWTMNSQELPWVAYQLPTPVTSSDVVAYTAPNLWLTTTIGSTGASPPLGQSGTVTATNYAGSLEPGVAGSRPMGVAAANRTMKASMNMSGPPVTNYMPWYPVANWMYRNSCPLPGVATYSSDGHPLTLSGASSSKFMYPNGTSFDSMAFPRQTGIWTFVADESAPSTPMTVGLISGTYSSQTTLTGPTITHGAINASGVEVGKQWQWNVTYPSGTNSWGIDLSIEFQTYNAVYPGPWTLSNEFLFSPTNNGPQPTINRSAPLTLDQSIVNNFVTPSGKTPFTLRWMDSTMGYGGTSNVVDATDLSNVSNFGWIPTTANTGFQNVTPTVTEIRPYDLSVSPYVYFWEPTWGTATGNPAIPYQYRVPTGNNVGYLNWSGGGTGWVIGECVTSAPHGLKTGQSIVFPGATVTFTNGPTSTYTGSFSGYGIVFVTSETTFATTVFVGGPVGGTAMSMPYGINNVYSAQSTSFTINVQLPDSAVVPYAAAAAATSSLASTNMWVNVPLGATNACVQTLAQKIRDNTIPGRKVYVEYSNETWNFYGPKIFLGGMSGLGILSSSGIEASYAVRASQIHQIFHDIFQQTDINGNSNRGGEIVRVFGAGLYQAGITTQQIVAEANAYNATRPSTPIQIDAIAVAPYIDVPWQARPDPSTAATVNPTGGGSTGGSLAAGSYYVCYTWVDALTGLESSFGSTQTTLPSPSAACTAVASGTTGSLPTGDYIVEYTYVSQMGGETASGNSKLGGTYGQIYLSAGNTLTITFNDTLPSWASGRNVYIGSNSASVQDIALYATGITAATYTASSALWTNGTTTQAAATLVPPANTAFQGTPFTVASGNIPRVTITLPTSPAWASSANIYLTNSGGSIGPPVKYMTGVTTTTVNLATANTGTVSPPLHSNIPSFPLGTASIWKSSPWSTAHNATLPAWTRAMYHDYYRHYIHYSTTIAGVFQSHQTAIALYVPVGTQSTGFVPEVVGYEGSVEEYSGFIGYHQTLNGLYDLGYTVSMDLFYDPEEYNTAMEWLSACQAGGLSFINCFDYSQPPDNINGVAYQWGFCIYSGQPFGYGDGSDGKAVNQFIQNTGIGQNQTNVAVRMQAWRDWADAANIPLAPTPYQKPRKVKWTPSLGGRIGNGFRGSLR